MLYEFLNKRKHRAVVHVLYLETRRRIVYLDDEHAGATSFFLSAGVPKRHLHPVNFAPAAAEEASRASGVACVCADVDTHMATLKTDSCGVVWLDYTKRTVTRDALREALRVAPHVFVTMSVRGVDRARHVAEVVKLVRAVGVLEEASKYRGASDVMNMATFHARRRSRATAEEETGAKGSVAEETIKDAARYAAGDRVVVTWRDGALLTAVVVADAGEGADDVRVRFDCDGVEVPVPCGKVAPNAEDVAEEDMDALVGTTLLIPTKMWRTAEGYTHVKRVGKKMAFRVVKRYYNGNRFTLSGVSKTTGRPLPRHESWTLTYDQARCFAR